MTDRYDIVLFGATGAAGRPAVPYLAERAGALGLRWAIAGRRPAALEDLAATCGGERPDVLTADLADPASLEDLARGTRVLLNGVGPYRRSGPPIVAACIAAGTDYLDLTGEIDVVAALLGKHHDAAVEAGARILQVCGYESLPFDLLTALAAVTAAERFDEPLAGFDVVGTAQAPSRSVRLDQMVSGGTWESLCQIVEEGDLSVQVDPAALVTDPAEAARVRSASPVVVRPWSSPQGVVMPMMPSPFINPAVVHRTAAHARASAAGTDGAGVGRFTPDFRYREGQSAGSLVESPAAQWVVAGPASGLQGAVRALSAVGEGTLRRGIAAGLRRIGPERGQGPPRDQLTRWSWQLHGSGTTPSGREVSVRLEADGHPGYYATSRMFAEAGLLLADDGADTPDAAGWVTPATGLGVAELDRFADAGLRFSVV